MKLEARSQKLEEQECETQKLIAIRAKNLCVHCG